MLNDSSTLEDVFRSLEDSDEAQPDMYTVHLVCNPKTNSPEYPSGTNSFAQRNQANPNNNAGNANVQSSNAGANSGTSSINPSSSSANVLLNNIQLPSTSASFVDAQQVSQQMAQQMYLMQQAYVQQMAQYFQNWQTNVTNPGPLDPNAVSTTTANIPPVGQFPPIIQGNFAGLIPGMPFIGSTPGLVPYPMLTVQLQPTEQQVQQVNANLQQQQAEAVEAAPAAVNAANDGENGDLLDQIYGVVQGLILLILFYLYSTIGRLFFMTLIICAVRGIRRWMQNRNAAAHQPNPPIMVQRGDDAAALRIQNMMDQRVEEIVQGLRRRNPEGPNEERDSAEATLNNGNVQQPPPPPEPQISKIRFIWLAVSTLFTSLMPENPPVNLN